MKKQLWQELYEKTVGGKIVWFRDRGIKTEIDGRKIELMNQSCIGFPSILWLRITDETDPSFLCLLGASPQKWWGLKTSIAGKLFDYILKHFAMQDEEQNEAWRQRRRNQLQQTLEILQRT